MKTYLFMFHVFMFHVFRVRFDSHRFYYSQIPAGEINAAQPTICDLDGDGNADIVFGLRDGRVIVYQTGLSYRPEWCQWPTANGNFQHTGVWMGANAH